MKTSSWTTAVLRNMLMALIITQFANALIIADDRIRSLDITPAIGRGYTFMTNSFHSICLEADELTIPSFNYDCKFHCSIHNLQYNELIVVTFFAFSCFSFELIFYESSFIL